MAVDEQEYYIADRGPGLYDANEEYLNAAGNPTGIKLRGGRFRNVYLDIDPAEDHEAVPKGFLSAGYVPIGRLINTTSPLAGGGDLSADRTLTLAGLTDLGPANYLVGAKSDASAWEYKQLLGTENQVVVTHAAGSVTLSLPQDFDVGATPTLGDLTLSTPVNIYALSHDSFADYVANQHMDTTAWAAHLIPADTDTYDLGGAGIPVVCWRELYLSGSLQDGTNAVSVAEIKTAYDHSLDSSQAHSDYLLNNASDSMNGTLTLTGDLRVDGGDIGITSDPNLIQMAANALTVNGTLTVTGSFVYGATANVFLQLGSSYIALRTEVNDSMYFDAGGMFSWRDVDGGYATRMTLNSATGDLGLTGDVTFGDGHQILSSGASLAFRTAVNDAMYFDAGGMFGWRDVDGAYAVRMTLDSSNGLLSPTTVQPTSGYNSVDTSAGITQTVHILDGDAVNTHILTFKNGILTAYTLGP